MSHLHISFVSSYFGKGFLEGVCYFFHGKGLLKDFKPLFRVCLGIVALSQFLVSFYLLQVKL